MCKNMSNITISRMRTHHSHKFFHQTSEQRLLDMRTDILHVALADTGHCKVHCLKRKGENLPEKKDTNLITLSNRDRGKQLDELIKTSVQVAAYYFCCFFSHWLKK